MENLIEPHGGQLVNLFCPWDKAEDFKKESIEYPSLNLDSSRLFDLELLMNGGFSPLRGFMTRREYESVLKNNTLPNGLIWPIPIYLDVPEERARELETGEKIALRDTEGFMLGVMTVSDVWKPDKTKEALRIYGTESPDHPGVARLFNSVKEWYVGGEITGTADPIHFDYKMLRMSPHETRNLFRKLGWRKIVAFEAHGPLHNAHKEMTLKAAMEHGANIFLNPIVGLTHPSDLDHYTRVRCYEAIIRNYPPDSVVLSLLPLAMRLAGPREALWHAIIRKNYGCSHFMVAENHADPHSFSDKKLFYPCNAAQQYVADHEQATGVKMVEMKKMVYIPAKAQYLPLDECKAEESHTFQELSAVELKRRLDADLDIPAWYSPPEVVEVLKKAYPPRSKRGFSIFLTGLSGSGKSTLAKVLMSRFMQIGERPVTLLDGDIVRKNLSSELGFSRHHRELNITRIGFVASEIAKNGGIAICAPIAAIADARLHNRNLISSYGGYIEVYVSTPLEVCEMRDRKGLYAKARAGILKGFTGIDDPYEIPANPEVTVDTSTITPYEATQEIMLYLKKEGYLG
ncbi:MAG: bifunctional sulfate adenylyltransferase/adenylylsulfate kinase [Desulfobulbaceae bacterium]|nr:bifunctional sulfate adenylyltransferase/adenylylsulfate kinase [Desulfobulbaceae bacterium]MCK5543727.1 bifunctional sulfate adenylyltransferase/adenylylsulfate kinase [Desulfobulbaceae bacterium]